jgi:multicomponent Na+:H+ antiporter subunit D
MILTHLPVLVPLLFLLAAIAVAGLGTWKRALAYPLALLATGAAFVVSIQSLHYVLTEGKVSYYLGGWAPPIGIEYVLDPLSAFFTIVVVGVALLVLLYAKPSVDREIPGHAVPYFAVCMLLLMGLTGIIITGDLFNLYVFLEISALSGYALVAVGDKQAPVSAFRYLLLGTIGASFYLLGVGFLYMVGGSLNMADVARILPHVQDDPTVISGVLLIVIGLGLKMALFPMHGWLPDAYTYAASASSALIAPVGTKVAAYAMLRILFFVTDPEYIRSTLPVADIVGWLSVGGILFGSVMAIAQKELKRMLAYSSVAQIGYIGMGIGLASPLGMIGAVLHVLNHAFMKSMLFLVAGNLRAGIGHSNIPDFTDSLRRAMPWTMAAFAVGALSMIGIPPTAGFFSKWYLVLAGIEASNWVFVGVILLSSLLNAVYFFRVLEKMYLRSKPTQANAALEHGNHDHRVEEEGFVSREVGAMMLVPTLVLAVGIVLLGIANALIVDSVIRLMIPSGL